MGHMADRNNVVLIGMPASGKSTVGVLLAKRAGLDFVDTDILIQKAEGKRLEEIISAGGIERFLEIEAACLTGSTFEGHVIATGGSAVYSESAMHTLKETGIVVYLAQDLPCLSDRIASLDSRGVVKMPGQDIASIFEERRPLYERYADITANCGTLPPDTIVSAIMDRLAALEFL